MTISVSVIDIQKGVSYRGLGPVRPVSTGSAMHVPTSSDQATANGYRHVTLLQQYALEFAPDNFIKMQHPNPNTKTITGIVTEESVAVARTLRCYRQSDGHFIAKTTSDAATGAFTFSGLVTSEQYFIVCFDDHTLLPNFNAKIFDQVVPV